MQEKIQIDRETLLKTYEECNKSFRKTAQKFGVSNKTIQRRFDEYHIEYNKKTFNKTSNNRTKYKCNEKFFDKLNEKSLYWLGFLATDGNVYSRDNRSSVITLSLATKDKNHIIQFKKDISFTGPIHDYITKKEIRLSFIQDQYFASTLNITSNKLADKLSEFNIIPRKTYTYTLPDILIDNISLHHFIRGCIDGDGWYRTHEKDNIIDSIRIGFCGNPEFVKQIFDKLKERCNLDNDAGTYCIEENTGRFEFSAHHDVKKIVDYLYQGANTFLKRKYDIAIKAYEVAENSKILDFEPKELQKQYDKLGSFSAVAKEFDCDSSSIKRHMIKHELSFKENDPYIHNELFFEPEQESEAQFYVAGYLVGKSSIRIYSETKKSLTITESNQEQIKKIKELLGTDSEIHSRGNSYSFSIFSKELIESLKRFNIDENKNTNYSIPDFIKKHNYLHHFLRGWFEAKSSVSTGQQKLIEFSGQENFLSDIKEILQNKCKLSAKVEIRQRKNKNSYRLSYSGKAIKNIIKFLYKDASIYLASKKEAAM